jgi:toxin ParE1/3/4
VKLAWSPLAFRRAQEVSEHIRQENPAAAEAWLQALFRVVDRLVPFPDSGRIVPELNKPEIREVLDGAYRVLYRRKPSRIEIVTIRHGRQLMDLGELKARS